MRILLVAVENRIVDSISRTLCAAGHLVDRVNGSGDALNATRREAFDVIVLDIMQPGENGLGVLRELRELRNASPVLLLTAHHQVSERIEGVNLGAGDYMIKPIVLDELIARVEALGRRAASARPTLVRVADLSMNLITRDVTRAGRTIDLATREFALLDVLMASPGQVLTHTQICEHVWEHLPAGGTNVVAVYVKRLRRKIDDGHELKLLHTVYGVGYTLKEGTA